MNTVECKNTMRLRWVVLLGLGLALVGAGVALTVTGSLAAQTLPDLYRTFSDPSVLRDYLRSYGQWTPWMFMMIQSLQVVISPIPGEATGLLGGYLFGVGGGVFYSRSEEHTTRLQSQPNLLNRLRP